MNWIVSKQPDE